MFGDQGSGYDRAITVFSPDGRLFQVEYAIEAVRRGTTTIGAKVKDGVVFCVESRVLPLQEDIGSEKLFKIDNHIGVAIAGLTADARILVDQGRISAQVNILSYSEKITVLDATKELCDYMQMYTQNAGVRPFGVALLVGGVDEENGAKLFMTDPSGAFWAFHATAIGGGGSDARDYLEQNYSPEISLDELKLLCIKTLKEVKDEDLEETQFEIAVITHNQDFKILSTEENKELLDKL